VSRIEYALCGQSLKRLDIHAVDEAGESSLPVESLLRGALFLRTTDLPGAETGKLDDQHRTQRIGQPALD
jgi:hypothetical protein